MPTRQNLSNKSNKTLLILLHAGFFLIGIITVLLGQILPILSARLSLNDQAAGYFFIAQFFGSLLGTLFFSQAIKKFGYLRMLAGGFWLMAVGCVGLNFDSLFWCLPSVFLYGIGIGLTIPTINLLVIEIQFQKSSSALNIINFFWGVGAILCKPFIDFVGSPNSILLPTALLAISFLVIGAAISFSNYQDTFKEHEKTSDGVTPIWTTKTAWLIAIFNFVHIGIESSIGGWITTYEIRLTELSATGWLSAALVYFLFLVIGRGIAPLFFRFLSENTVLLSSLLIMLGGIIVILWAKNSSLLILGAAILGAGASSVFPTNMGRFTKIFGAEAIQNATPIFVLGGLGGAFTTWLIGFVSTTFNNLRAGFFIILISCLLLISLQIILANANSKRKVCRRTESNRHGREAR